VTADARRSEDDSRLKATFRYAEQALQAACRKGVELYPASPVRIPVRGGVFEVTYPEPGPILNWCPCASKQT